MKEELWSGYKYTGYSIKLSGEWWVGKLVEEGDLIVDCGANKGEWSDSILKNSLGVGKRIIAFEPQDIPQLRERFGKEVKIEKAAVGNANKEVYFWEYGELSSTVDLKYSEAKKTVVNMIKLDDYFKKEKIDKVEILKLDLEGGEYQALLGVQKAIANSKVEVIVFEYGGTYLKAGTTLKDMWDFLKGYGYEMWMITKNVMWKMGEEFKAEMENYKYANFLAIRRNSAKMILMKNKLNEGK